MPPVVVHDNHPQPIDFKTILQAVQQSDTGQWVAVALAAPAVVYTLFFSAKSLSVWIWAFRRNSMYLSDLCPRLYIN